MNSHEDFHKAVELERETLTRLCDYWSNKIKCDANVGDTEGRIRATVGKTRLLLAEKFKQFEGLLEQSENNTSEKEISFNDLQGFWELVLIQVNEVKDLFRSFGPTPDKILDLNNDQKPAIKGNKKGPTLKKKSEDQVDDTDKKLQEIIGSDKKQSEVEEK